jgi:hypothetical protein
LEGVVILHETIHELHSKKLDEVLFKIDFEKAYDKVKWPFLHQNVSARDESSLGRLNDFLGHPSDGFGYGLGRANSV